VAKRTKGGKNSIFLLEGGYEFAREMKKALKKDAISFRKISL